MKIPLCKCGAKLFLRNGLPVNKYCPKCRKAQAVKLREKKEKLKLDKLEKQKAKEEKRKTTKKYQESEYRKLHNKAWKLISIKVRMNGADNNGINSCYTCGERRHWKELQAGHYWHDRLDFDERNLKPQCPQCNRYLSGNLAVYGARLLRENGEEWMKQLEIDAKNTIYKSADIQGIIELLISDMKLK